MSASPACSNPSIDWQTGAGNGWGNRVSPFAGASVRTGGYVPDFKLSWSTSPLGEGARYDSLGAALSKTTRVRGRIRYRRGYCV